ncbi:MAG: N-acetyl-gamma-glutamyl-phosphate reductase [Deltaproteobacteria bacterium]|nr:N-acetyl-gamma-glutamyl-phosphate reductase [Deltaproteobacteria bacterium]
MIRVGIVGATGYAGAELIRILSGHPGVEITILTSRQYAGQRIEDIFPALRGRVDLRCEPIDTGQLCAKTDIVFTALPHRIPMNFVPDLLECNKKVIDLSADFRFSDPNLYESAYESHLCPDLLKTAVYGLSEIYRADIAVASLVGNPGCYPTCTLLPLLPLVSDGIISASGIIVDAKSGVSGAGRGLSLPTHFCEANESVRAYKVAAHRHEPEIEEILCLFAGEPVDITFVPHLMPMSRGMESTIYADLSAGAGSDDIAQCLKKYYSDKKFIRINTDGTSPDTRNVRFTNYCDIGFVIDEKNRRLILMSAIDNLVKGAAGQAVQNMNIMAGLDEGTGLCPVPFPL